MPTPLAPGLAATHPDAAHARRARWVLLISAALTIALFRIPQAHVVAYPLMLISTVVHELGHGIAAVLAGGDFVQLVMARDGSGAAQHVGHYGRFALAFIAAGGLVGPALAAGVFLAVARRPRWARIALGAFGLFLALALLLWVRDSFPAIFIGGLAAICLAIAVKAPDGVGQLTLVFLATQLALSAWSRSDYLFTRVAETASGPMPSDVSHMADALLLPYWFWGALCALFSLIVLLIGGWRFIRGAPRARPIPSTPTTRVP
jgi:hypothetical protein